MAPFLEKLLPYVIFSILALAGVATAIGGTSVGIFITILVLALLGAAFTCFQKFLLKKVMKSSNSYQVRVSVLFNYDPDITYDPFQINVQSDGSKKSGIANAGFDVEKGGREEQRSQWTSWLGTMCHMDSTPPSPVSRKQRRR